MLKASDIQNKEFTKGIRGYKEEEVDEFLDEIIADYQTMADRIAELESQLSESNARLAEYKSTEGAVLTTLESAKALMNDIAQSAEKRAKALIENAELEAANKLRLADDSLSQLKAEEARLQTRVINLKARIKSELEAELARINELDGNALGE